MHPAARRVELLHALPVLSYPHQGLLGEFLGYAPITGPEAELAHEARPLQLTERYQPRGCIHSPQASTNGELSVPVTYTHALPGPEVSNPSPPSILRLGGAAGGYVPRISVFPVLCVEDLW